jgi:DNA-binding NarL/FixJ family response regulator
MAIRVVLADDHILFTQALAELLAEKYELLDIVTDGKALVASVRQHNPDVVLVDVTMPLMNGLDSARLLRKEPGPPKIIFLTMHSERDLVRECFHSGASGFLTKESGFEEIANAIDAVMANQTYVSRNSAVDLAGVLSEPLEGRRTDELTSRQREILQLFAEGKTMKEIAFATNLSTRTVEWHKYRMMRMLHVRRSAELVQYAVKMKLVS